MLNKSLPKIAVCLAVHNGMQWLPEQIDSILAQTGVQVTVFVSVDKSSDGSQEWLDQRAAHDPRIALLPHDRVFGGAAANFFWLLQNVDFTGFDCASLADQDDIWHPGKLQRACQQMQACGAEGYSSNVRAFWPDGKTKWIEKAQAQTAWDFVFEAAGPGCTYVLNRDLALALQEFLQAQQANLLQEVALHDWLIYAYARSHGWRWHIDSQPGLDYRQHSRNQVGVNHGWWAMRKRAAKVLNGWAFGQAALIAGLVGLQTQAFVSSWLARQPWGVFTLAFRARQCRRRRRDQALFALSCVLAAGVLFGKRFQGIQR